MPALVTYMLVMVKLAASHVCRTEQTVSLENRSRRGRDLCSLHLAGGSPLWPMLPIYFCSSGCCLDTRQATPDWRTRAGGQVATVSAASFRPSVPLAPHSIAAAFGAGLATRTELAVTHPLPKTLAGTSVRVNGEAAPLFFVSPGQINYLIPPRTPSVPNPPTGSSIAPWQPSM